MKDYSVLLNEEADRDSIKNTIVESTTNPGEQNFFIEGIFIQADKKNRNGRIYPIDTVINEVSRYNTNFVDQKRALGELGHPENLQVNLHLASHLITNLRQEGKDFIGKAKIISTPMGEIAKSMIRDGVKLGVSSRGAATMKEENGVKYVGEDFYLSTVDIVWDPSAPQAFVEGIMESRSFYVDKKIITEQEFDNIQREAKSLTRSQLSEGALLGMFESFLDGLRNK